MFNKSKVTNGCTFADREFSDEDDDLIFLDENRPINRKTEQHSSTTNNNDDVKNFIRTPPPPPLLLPTSSMRFPIVKPIKSPNSSTSMLLNSNSRSSQILSRVPGLKPITRTSLPSTSTSYNGGAIPKTFKRIFDTKLSTQSSYSPKLTFPSSSSSSSGRVGYSEVLRSNLNMDKASYESLVMRQVSKGEC